MSTDPQPIVATRLRRIDGSFGFIPHRFLRDGFLQSLTDDELRLYLVLVLVADRQGHSFYSHQRLRALLAMSSDAYLRARESLLRKDLIAADGVRVQLLSLPAQPVEIAGSTMSRRDQATACQAILASLATANQK
jgi:hypothetical protein